MWSLPSRVMVAPTLLGLLLAGCGDSGSSADVVARLDAIEGRLERIENRLDERRADPGRILRAPGDGEEAGPSEEAGTLEEAGSRVEARGAVVVAESPSHDFGEVWSGSPIDHVFRVRNDGDEPVEILAITPGCTCLVLGDHSGTIAPGGRSEIPVQLRTVKLKGRVTQTAVVRTDDIRTPELTLALTGVVRPVVEFESFVLIRARPGAEALERRVEIVYRREGDLELELQERGEDRFDVDLVETRPGKAFDLVVRVAPPFEVGYQRAVVTLTTNLPERESLHVRLNLHVPDRLDVIPSQLLVDDRTGEEVTRQLVLTNYGERPVRVFEATVDDPVARTALVTRESGVSYTITVAFAAGFRLPAGGRKLTLRTDDPEKPIIEIPVRSMRSSRRSSGQRERPRRPALDLIDKPAPDFHLLTVAGDELSTRDLGSSVATVLNFFAPNCGFCKRQLPFLEKVRAAFEERGVRFVNVREVMGRPYTIEETETVLATLGTDLELAVDDANNLGKRFRVSGFPTLFLVDREGIVRHVRVGAGVDIAEDLSARLETMLAASQ